MFIQRGKFRHVIFADAINGCSRAVDFSPVTTQRLWAKSEISSLQPDQESFVRWLFRQAGLDSRHYREETLSRRLAACLRSLRVNSIQQARATLQHNPQLIGPTVGTMLIGVTSFFRDAQVFQTLRQTVLPDLLRRSGGTVRIWSLGCSNGAELYSIAMLLQELGGLKQARLLGTDCRAGAIARASAGTFDADAMENVPRFLLTSGFYFSGGQYHASRHLRSAMEWRCCNALNSAEPGPWDLILCRNMTMYLRPASCAVLWSRLGETLRHGGLAILGKAERPSPPSAFAAIAPCIYQRMG